MRGAPISLLALWIYLSVACGRREPTYTLKEAMYQVDWADKHLKELLITGGNAVDVASRAQEMALWIRDPSFERYIDGPSFRGEPMRFHASRAEFEAKLSELILAARAGEIAAASRAYAPMRMACESCHKEFRPELGR
jgi:hypothetical protein